MTDNDLVSVRGLVESEYEEVLREFTGTFVGYETSPATGYAGTRVSLNFKDIDNVVCAAGSVYNFPTKVINLGLSNKKKSKFGYLGDSLAALLAPDEDIKDAEGRTMKLVYCDGQDGRPAPKPIWMGNISYRAEFPDKMVPTVLWIVVEVDGAGAVEAEDGVASAAEWAEQNLIGKTKAEFNKWAFADARVRKDTALQRSISDKSFVTSLIQLGRVVEDGDGIFQQAEIPF